MDSKENNLILTPMQAAGALRYASTYNGSGQYTSEQLAIAKDMACEALEKQIPKNPIDINSAYDGDYGRCPCCNSCIADYSSHKRCKECGQALDWSDVK